MFRLVVYTCLGLLLSRIFGPLFTMSNIGALCTALVGGLFGAIVAIDLNKALGTKPEGSIENVISYAWGRLPWVLRPQTVQDKIFDWFRSRFH